MKLAAEAKADAKYIICNADEGEPGTFKDREILSKVPYKVLTAMAVCGYITSAKKGIIYLRGEYAYLKNFLEKMLEERRGKGLLGKGLLEKADFDFDIRIQQYYGKVRSRIVSPYLNVSTNIRK